jgi:hypothetical protein
MIEKDIYKNVLQRAEWALPRPFLYMTLNKKRTSPTQKAFENKEINITQQEGTRPTTSSKCTNK